MNPTDGLRKHNIFTDAENKKRCYGGEDLNSDEPILFLHGPFIVDENVVVKGHVILREKIITDTVCLNYKEAQDILRELHINHFVGGYRDEQIKNIRYYVNMMDERKSKKRPTPSADLSNLKFTPREKQDISKEKERDDLNRIFNKMKIEDFEYSTETGDYIRNQKGMYLHSKDMDTPSIIRQDTGEQSFHNMGRLIMKKLPDGRTINYSMKTGRPVK